MTSLNAIIEGPRSFQRLVGLSAALRVRDIAHDAGLGARGPQRVQVKVKLSGGRFTLTLYRVHIPNSGYRWFGVCGCGAWRNKMYLRVCASGRTIACRDCCRLTYSSTAFSGTKWWREARTLLRQTRSSSGE